MLLDPSWNMLLFTDSENAQLPSHAPFGGLLQLELRHDSLTHSFRQALDYHASAPLVRAEVFVNKWVFLVHFG